MADGSINLTAPYINYFSRFGTVVPIYALDEHVNRDIDLLVLIGGADVNPSRYTNELHWMTQNPNIQLEFFDINVLPNYIDANIPIFGICRGFQTLNVHFGGQLHQHIQQKTSTISRADAVDKLTATSQGLTYCLDNAIISQKGYNRINLFEVNSLHHQGFFMEDCGEGIIPLLSNNQYNNVEAFTVRDKPIFAVQWHPEELWDTFSTKTIQNLIAHRHDN
jgi:putative glutamine amidotransferase